MTEEEQRLAKESYDALSCAINNLPTEHPEIKIEGIKVPASTLKFLEEILWAMNLAEPISLVPLAAEMTTQKATQMLGCSRPYLVKLLEEQTTKIFQSREAPLDKI